MTLTDEVIWDLLDEALQKLGTDPDKIARTFEARGHTGRPGIACDCPMAHYLESELGDVSPIVLTTRIDVRGCHRHVITIQPTAAVTTFVRRFDTGHYPALVRAAA